MQSNRVVNIDHVVIKVEDIEEGKDIGKKSV